MGVYPSAQFITDKLPQRKLEPKQKDTKTKQETKTIRKFFPENWLWKNVTSE